MMDLREVSVTANLHIDMMGTDQLFEVHIYEVVVRSVKFSGYVVL